MPTLLPTADCLMPKVQPEMSTWQYMAYGAWWGLQASINLAFLVGDGHSGHQRGLKQHH